MRKGEPFWDSCIMLRPWFHVRGETGDSIYWYIYNGDNVEVGAGDMAVMVLVALSPLHEAMNRHHPSLS